MARPVKNNTLTFKEALDKYSKDYISDLYYNKSISTVQLAKNLNVGRSVFYKLLNHYGLEKEPLYYDNSFELVLNSIDQEAFKADLPVIGYVGALEKYNINRTQFYKICDRLHIDYKTLIGL